MIYLIAAVAIYFTIAMFVTMAFQDFKVGFFWIYYLIFDNLFEENLNTEKKKDPIVVEDNEPPVTTVKKERKVYSNKRNNPTPTYRTQEKRSSFVDSPPVFVDDFSDHSRSSFDSPSESSHTIFGGGNFGGAGAGSSWDSSDSSSFDSGGDSGGGDGGGGGGD